MNETTKGIYMAMLAHAENLAMHWDGEIYGYHVVDGNEREFGHPRDILQWHRHHLDEATSWAMVSVAHIIASLLDPV